MTVATTLTKWTPGLAMSGWDSEENYAGERIDGYYVIGTNRDANPLVRSNYETILRDLKEVAEEEGAPDSVYEAEFGHWACGWVKQIIVAADAPPLVFTKAEDIREILREESPIWDEDHYYELVEEEAAEYWNGLSSKERMEMAKEQACGPIRPLIRYAKMTYSGLCMDGSETGEALRDHLRMIAEE